MAEVIRLRQGVNVVSALLETAHAAERAQSAVQFELLERNAMLLRALRDSSLEYRRAVLAMKRIRQAVDVKTARRLAGEFLDSIR